MDNSGVRVYYTEQLRANDAGVMAVGMAVSPMHIVPPRQSAYKTASLCDKDCTNVIFPERGIKITSVMLHAHLASRKLKLRHIRHDQEMANIARVYINLIILKQNVYNFIVLVLHPYFPYSR